MALVVSPYMKIYRRFKPHLLMVLAQIGYACLYFITDASFNHGMNPHVFVTYRHIMGGLVMFPFAYFLERKARPKLTLALFMEIFVISLLGVSLTLNMYFASLKYTSSSFVTSIANTIPSLTFLIAVILRMEALDVRNPRGIAKLLGTLISLAGVITMTSYKGPAIQSFSGASQHIRSNFVHKSWTKGSILVIASCITWSIWYIMQGITLKKYPAQLSLTTWINCIGAAQSAVFTVIIQHKRAAWRITYNNDFWSIIYAGVVCSGITIFIQLWCTKQKGPVFVTMFSPLATALVAILAYFILGEKLHIGRIVGAVIIIIGLYLVLWGKDRDQNHFKSQEQPTVISDNQKDPKMQVGSSAERQVLQMDLEEKDKTDG
ncbi:putative EamA domain-containing protein [Rosa chinensis]|uniref:WAT1-related protein n=1 Tax=Rosa chinensis TaxID=74649 RepID=A0A2P6PVD1_ROSCH|nr:WAT1-related protein At1g44800 isoform X2 [Rosa chinensis]PRQ25880.1 putative EamA domain-containing protein [Rosa chinensis]